MTHSGPSYPPSLLHWVLLKKGCALSLSTPPPPAPRRRAGSNCSSCGKSPEGLMGLPSPFPEAWADLGQEAGWGS